MSNSFKLCPTYFSRGTINFAGGTSPAYALLVRAWLTATSNSSTGSTPSRDQANVITLPAPRRPLGCFPVGVASRTCHPDLSLGILVKGLKHRSWELFFPKGCSTFRALRSADMQQPLHTKSRSYVLRYHVS